MSVNNKSGHIKGNCRQRRERFAFIVKQFEFDNPESTQIVKI